jgi:plastocyanin
MLMGCAALAAASLSAQRASAASLISVSIEGLSFVPAQISVTVGTTVVFVNRDLLPHAVVGKLGETELFHSDGQLDQDESFAVVLDEPGLIEVTCGIHSRMRARLTVTR